MSEDMKRYPIVSPQIKINDGVRHIIQEINMEGLIETELTPYLNAKLEREEYSPQVLDLIQKHRENLDAYIEVFSKKFPGAKGDTINDGDSRGDIEELKEYVNGEAPKFWHNVENLIRIVVTNTKKKKVSKRALNVLSEQYSEQYQERIESARKNNRFYTMPEINNVIGRVLLSDELPKGDYAEIQTAKIEAIRGMLNGQYRDDEIDKIFEDFKNLYFIVLFCFSFVTYFLLL